MGGNRSGESMSDAETEVFADRRFRPPVATLADLPTEDVRNGDMCVIQEDGSVYEYHNGIWELEVTGGVILD